MEDNRIFAWILVFIFAGTAVSSCKKQQQDYSQAFLEVNFPRLTLKHNRYYSVSYLDRSLEMEFSEPLDYATVTGNIRFSDQSGPLDGFVDLQVSGRHVMVLFHPEFELHNGWQYFITIGAGVRSGGGKTLSSDRRVEMRTTGRHPDLVGTGPNGDTTIRTSVAVISDIHMGEPRANQLKYCWFGNNNAALLDLLERFDSGYQIKQVVILGDLFDAWIVPYTLSPFDAQTGVTDTKSYFHAVADNPVNQPIVAKFQDIVLNPEIDLIYVPGNHDMLLTNEILQEIIPGIIWKGDTAGLGKYLPAPEIMLEHGHRYDFFNCPQPLVNPGHMLPPGYFISRLYAQGTMEHPGLLKGIDETAGSVEFRAAWDLAYWVTLVQLGMTWPDPFAENILMGGIDGYPTPFSFFGAKEMYASNIEDQWMNTQIRNMVPYPMACCFHAIWNGHSDLFTAAKMEYLDPALAPRTYRIVGFGHTHDPLIDVYPKSSNYTAIYANSGSWVDPDRSTYPVRTYLIITPGAWSGSAIDVVSLYQYNLEGSQGTGYEPKLLAEENI